MRTATAERVYVTAGTPGAGGQPILRAEVGTTDCQPPYRADDTYRVSLPLPGVSGDSVFALVLADRSDYAIENVALTRAEAEEAAARIRAANGEVCEVYEVVVGGEKVEFGDETWTVYAAGGRVLIRTGEGVFPLDTGATPESADALADALRRVAENVRETV